MRAMLEPNNLRAMVQMQQAMQQLSGNFPGMPPMPGGAPASGAPAPSAGGLDFSSLLGGAPAPAPMANPFMFPFAPPAGGAQPGAGAGGTQAYFNVQVVDIGG